MNRHLFLKAGILIIKGALTVFFVFSAVVSHSQPGYEKGLPFITNYSNKITNASASNWSVVQADDGTMYFGNTNLRGNVLEYDGVNWNKIAAPASSVIVRNFGKDKNGRIYYGGSGDFGYLALNDQGETVEHSLLTFVPRDKRNFFDVWSVYATDEGVYFQSRERLFRLTRTGDDKTEKWVCKTWDPDTHFMYSFYVDQALYVHEQNIGLLKMTHDSLVLIKGSEFLGKDRMQVMLPYTGTEDQGARKKYLLASFTHGLYLFDGKDFAPFRTSDDKVFTSNMVYKGLQINGNYAISVLGTGLVIMNPEGKILQIIDRNSGLPSNIIYSPYIDSKGDLWLAMDNGISKIDYNSPFTVFDLQSGILSSPLSMARLPDGALFLGTQNGLLQFNAATSKFELVSQVPRNQVFNLIVDGNTLLVANEGLFMIRNGKVILVQPSLSNNLKIANLTLSKKYPDLLYASTSFGVCLFVRQPASEKGWKFAGYFPVAGGEIHFLQESDDGNMWALSQNGTPYRITPFFDANGHPDVSRSVVRDFSHAPGFDPSFNSMFSINHRVYFHSDSASYFFDPSSQHFEKARFEGIKNFFATEDSSGKIWIAATRSLDNGKAIIATSKPGGGYQLDSTSLLPLSEERLTRVFPDVNNKVWFLTSDGLIRYNENKKVNADQPYATLIRRISSDTQRINPLASSEAPPEIKFNHNSLRFEYAAPFYEKEDRTQYQTWMEGFDKGWSEWGKNTYKEYTNLSPGKYTFHVRARNIYDKISREAVYPFAILPPWYRTWWAYCLYALVFLSAGLLILKWRTRKLKEKHRELEKTIDERTAELSNKVEELAVINSVQEGLVAQLDIDKIYELVGEKIREIFNAQTIVIATYHPGSNLITEKYAYEKGDRTLTEPYKAMGFGKHVIESREPLLLNKDVVKEVEKYGSVILGGATAKSVVFVPMIENDRATGLITLQNMDLENAFTGSDVNLLKTLANSMTVALKSAQLFDETARLLKETEQRTAELSVINSVQEGLAKELHMQAIYELVGDKLSEVMHTLDIDIRLFNPETGQVFFPYMRDHGERLNIPPGKLSGISRYVYETRQPTIINEDLPGKMKELGSFSIPGTQMEKSFMAVPIIVGNKVLGMVSMSNYEKEKAFSDSDLRLLQTVVSAMSVALDNARLFDETTRLLKETEQRTAELGVINSVQEGLVKEMNMQAIYELVGKRLCDLFPDTQTLVIRTFDQSRDLENWQFAIEKGVRLYSQPRPINWLNKDLIRSQKPILINDHFLQTAQRHAGINVTIGEPPKSVIFVPMIVGDVVKGSVSLQNVDRENAFTESDLRLLTTLTNSMSVALENARLFDETNHLLAQAKQRASELSTVNNISKALASKLNPNDLIQLVGDQLRDLFNANIVYLALLNKKTNIIHFPYQYGDNMTPMKLGAGLTSNIILKGEPLLFNKDVDEETDMLGLKRIGVPAASYLGVPIPVGDEIIGVLSVQSTEQENRFDENDLRLLSTIASSVGVALRNAQLFEDVEQAKMEAERATKIAEKANEAKSAFLSTVSHELRTPLTSVLGFAKIISKRLHDKIFPIVDQSDPKTEKTVNQINENLQVVISEGERLTHLINDVLDLAKIEAGRMEWSQEEVSLAEVAERAISATTSLFEQKGIELVKKIDENVPFVLADLDKLIQVVINLFSNAVKFTEKGAVTCEVSRGENEVIVRVKDTGIGIAPEDFEAVFEQFKQVGGDTLTDKPKGTGLGLPICKEIVEHHGGRIWVESRVGEGSTFSFAIPFVPSENTPHQKPIHLNDLVRQLKEQMVFSELKPGSRHSTILVVDDDDSIRSLLEQELSEAGYLIEQATNGKQALECIRKNRPDLIILDVMMPEMNGFDVAAILKNDPQTMDIPIIILSIVQDKARGFRIGVDRYLTKPIDTAQLFTEVGNLLEQGKSKKKVMVVDEDAAAVRSLTEVLQAKGYQVVESDGKELAEQAIATKPDIIILNSVYSAKQEIVKTLRFEKGLENVLFFIYQ